ncbi:hypothetical protein [Dysgonomonas sp. Marseille-P4361]|uniref:hypothetical protein n=1 Tax=Dysgonomonas sp. Marseille-P4361 TaxID=2161820 RepID=UPI000D54B773|nr:hypothetical protein [Dysgonomonas sp. Marseille-P4361]
MIIGAVWDQSLSDKVSVGDKILSINDFNLEELDECQLLFFKLTSITKETNIFKLKDKDGNIKEVEIKEE